jgi:hypothetical protein
MISGSLIARMPQGRRNMIPNSGEVRAITAQRIRTMPRQLARSGSAAERPRMKSAPECESPPTRAWGYRACS